MGYVSIAPKNVIGVGLSENEKVVLISDNHHRQTVRVPREMLKKLALGLLQLASDLDNGTDYAKEMAE